MSDGSSPSRVGPGITPGPTAALDLSGDPRRHRRERAMGSLFFVAAVMSVVISAAIIFSLFSRGSPPTPGTPARTSSASGR